MSALTAAAHSLRGITNYGARPVEWTQDRLGEKFWSAQRRIAESVRDNRYTAVPASHGVGKSYGAARIMGWWNDTHPTGSTFVVSTAPTAAQVSSILWRELGRVHTLGKLRGRINRAGYPQWYDGAELIGYGRKPSDYDQSAFQGLHAQYILIVIDEAGGVQKHLFDAVDALATNANARVLALGNPDDPGSHFAKICTPDSGWNVIHIDGLRTPNFSRELVVGSNPAKPTYPLTAALMEAEKIPYSTEDITDVMRQALIGPLWVEERIKRWAGVPISALSDTDTIVRRCANSPIFSAKVRGTFPVEGTQGVIPLGWIQRAMERWHDWDDAGKPNPPGRRVIGADPARYGADDTAIAVRQGHVVQHVERHPMTDTEDTANYVSAHDDRPGVLAVIDVIGIGAGVYDLLRAWRRDGKVQLQAIAFNAAGNTGRMDTIGQFKFRNNRAAAWWLMRDALDPSRGSQVCLPDDEDLLTELSAPRYNYLAGGVIQIESKDQIRARLGRSTDSADAVIQTFWIKGDVPDSVATGVDNLKWRNATEQERNANGIISYRGMSDFGEWQGLG